MDEQNLIDILTKKVTTEIERNKITDNDKTKELIQNIVRNESDEGMTINEQYELINNIYNIIKKLGVLQPLIDDKSITEIMINGPSDIFIEKDGRLEKVKQKFSSKSELEDIVQRIVSKVNREVNASNPICDARLEDGSRINIVLDPIALNGPIITIRKFPEKVISFEDLIGFGAITTEATEFLKACIKAKYNIFVSGGTGSGKTTFLNALSNFIPKDERIITIEDSAELQIQSVENLVRLETRNANTEGKGAISIRDLIKSSLRMRPERIVVGEVRGAEALDMLQAMNTGHDGSLSTGHANSAKDMLSRLETMVLTGANFPIEAIRQQISSAIDIIVHLGRLSDKSRKVLNIVEILSYENEQYHLNELYTFTREEKLSKGKIIGSLKRTDNKMINKHKFIISGIEGDKW